MNFWGYAREEDIGKPFAKEDLTGASVEYLKSGHIQFTLTDGRIVTLGTGEDNYNFGEIELIPRKQSLYGKRSANGGFDAMSSTPQDGYERLAKGDEDDPAFVKPFYLKTDNGKIVVPYQRSDVPQTGYVLHPAFVKQPVGDL